jgi:hypothetical protein
MHPTTERTWWQRNLKWVILAAILAALLCFLAFLAGIFYLVLGAMRSSEVYQTALARVQSHPAAIAQLGRPIEAGLLFSGNSSVHPRSGEADIGMPVSGPLGEASISVIAHKRGGTWYFDEMQLRGSGTEPLELRTATEIEAAQTYPRLPATD